ncbi:MAG: hypothetical protein ABUT20_17585 [Bacteroidota bacterium]
MKGVETEFMMGDNEYSDAATEAKSKARYINYSESLFAYKIAYGNFENIPEHSFGLICCDERILRFHKISNEIFTFSVAMAWDYHTTCPGTTIDYNSLWRIF